MYGRLLSVISIKNKHNLQLKFQFKLKFRGNMRNSQKSLYVWNELFKNELIFMFEDARNHNFF
jgi:hypothetical protein